MSRAAGQTYKCSEVGRNCVYRRKTEHNGMATCDYLLMTKHRRGCPPEECDKYERRIRKRRKSK